MDDYKNKKHMMLLHLQPHIGRMEGPFDLTSDDLTGECHRQGAAGFIITSIFCEDRSFVPAGMRARRLTTRACARLPGN
jgi:hypothetical protein